jgi:putative transposase
MNNPASEHDARKKLTDEEICQLSGAFRIVQLGGIEFESLRYQSPALSALRMYLQSKAYQEQRKSGNQQDMSHKAKVQIKYDPMDLSTLYVYDARPDHEDWLPVPADNQKYTKGLSIDEHKVIRNYILRQKTEVDIDGLAAAKRQIRGIVERQFGLVSKVQVRKMVARYLGSGSESAPGTAPNLPASFQLQNGVAQEKGDYHE